MPLISVVTAASRGADQLRKLCAQFAEQSFQDFEHILVYDGPAPEEVRRALSEVAQRGRILFSELPEREGKYGTAPRNQGIELARGEFVVFADDDDLYHRDYLQAFAELGLDSRTLGLVRMNNYGTVIPRHPLREFPRECHVGTPSCCFSREQLQRHQELRWMYDGRYSHDYEFVKNYVRVVEPVVKLNPRVVVRATNERIMSDHGMTGSRRERYLSWDEPNGWLRAFAPAKSDTALPRALYRLGAALTKQGA